MPNYTFQYFTRDVDTCGGEFPIAKSINTTCEFEDASPWDVVLNEFLNFLSSVYGYDISKHVDVQTFQQRMAAFSED